MRRVAALLLALTVHVCQASKVDAQTALPENIPDFLQDATRVHVETAQSGPWSSASTWQGGQVPTANTIVHILQAHTVTITSQTAAAYTVSVDGKLAFLPSVNTRLNVTNLQVMAGEMGMGTRGVLEVGTVASPIAAGATAEIVIANTPLGGGVPDPLQFGTGVIVLGRLTVHGSVRTPTFVRLGAEPRAGQTTLTLSAAVSGWRVGDRIVLPDTRHIKESEVLQDDPWLNAVNQWEERTIAALSTDGKTLTLNSPLQFDHLGARDLDGKLDFLPHVGNLARNVVIRSASAGGTRGHVLMTHLANVDVRYALFKDLGRTKYLPLTTTSNAIGRYPVHMHHLSGPLPTPANGYQFTLLGNAVDGGSAETQFKWGVAVHGSHYGLIQDNVVYNYNGASIATEDGSESFNVFDHNFALRGIGEPNDEVSQARQAMGTEGVGFWFRGPNNFVRNNVAANFQNPTTEASYGFVYQFSFLGDIAVPDFKGAHDMPGAPTSQFTVHDGNAMPLLQFENNEAYGAMQGGFTAWWVSSSDPEPAANAKESVIKDLKLWHTYNKTVYMYPSQKVVFDGLKIRGNFDPETSRCCGNGVYFADYSSKDVVIRNSDIQGMEEGITAPEAGFGPGPNLTVLNSYLRSISNLDVPSNGSVNGCWMDPKLVVAIDTRFAAPPGFALDSVSTVGDVAFAPECLGVPSQIRVYGFNGVPSDNFQIYHGDPRVAPRPPAGCTTVRPAGIDEVACSIPAIGRPPAVTATVSAETVQAGQHATLTWSTTGASTVTIDGGIGVVAASGAVFVFPTKTTTYTVTASNPTAVVTAAATVMVTDALDTPPLISGVVVTDTVANLTIAYTTSEPAAVQFEYGPTPAYGSSVTDDALQTAHSHSLPGLSRGTLYHYRIRATDEAGNTAVSPDATFTTLPAEPSAVMVAFPSFIIRGSSATLQWNTQRAATVSIAPGIGAVDAFGTLVVSPAATTTYTLTATNPAGSVSVMVTVVVNPPARSDTRDFDQDGKAELAIYRPSTGQWFLKQSSTNFTTYLVYQWGLPGDIPVPGDHDGDRLIDLVLYRPSSGMWFILLSTTHYSNYIAQEWGGASGDVPVAGDYDGDGRNDLAIFRPSSGSWFIKLSSTNYGSYLVFQWGLAGDVTVPGDYDGDGKADIAVYRPSSGVWYVLRSSSGYTSYIAQTWGVASDVPVPADYDGDGRTDPAVYRPSAGTWLVKLSGTDYQSIAGYQWGLSTDVAVPGDYDGDGRADLAIYRPSAGTWFVKTSTSGYISFFAQQWGVSTDIAAFKRQ